MHHFTQKRGPILGQITDFSRMRVRPFGSITRRNHIILFILSNFVSCFKQNSDSRLGGASMKKIIGLALAIGLSLGCRETRSITSTEVGNAQSSADFQVSDAEAARIMQIVIQKIEAGEDISPNLTRMIQIIMNKTGPDASWQNLTVDADKSANLKKKYSIYLGLYQKALDSFNFVAGCDGLLFTSLLVAAGHEHDLSLAESSEQPGRWYRSADHDCYPSGKSKSSISRDMLLGLSLALWQKSDGAAVKRILQFSQKNKGILGDAIDSQELAGAATMSPSLLSMLSEMDFQINATNSDNRGYFPELGKNFSGFEAHLLALRLTLKSSLYGGLLRTDAELISSLAQKQPRNALFQALNHAFTDGDGNAAAAILLDEKLFPATALPTSAQRCEPYLWQRDQKSTDWLPCPEAGTTFPAVDFFWVYALLNSSFRR